MGDQIQLVSLSLKEIDFYLLLSYFTQVSFEHLDQRHNINLTSIVPMKNDWNCYV